MAGWLSDINDKLFEVSMELSFLCFPPHCLHLIIIDWTIMVVGVSLLRVRRPGIRCQTVFVTQLWVLAFSGAPENIRFCEILTRRT